MKKHTMFSYITGPEYKITYILFYTIVFMSVKRRKEREYTFILFFNYIVNFVRDLSFACEFELLSVVSCFLA